MATAIDNYGLEHKHSHWLETAADVPYNLKIIYTDESIQFWMF